MKFVRQNVMTETEAAHAYSPDAAVSLFTRSLDIYERIDGLADLRSDLTTSFDFDVVDQLKKGQWRLVDKAAYRFDRSQFDGRVKQQKQQIGAMALTELPKNIVGLAVCVLSSYRAEAIKNKECMHGVEGQSDTGRSNVMGVVKCAHATHHDEMMVQIGY